MESFIHADIFFFITSIAVIIISIFLAIVLIYLTTILADIREISRIARSESAEIADDIKMIRQEVHQELRRGKSVFASIMKILSSLFRQKRARINK